MMALVVSESVELYCELARPTLVFSGPLVALAACCGCYLASKCNLLQE